MPHYTAGERTTAAAALRHYPAELVEQAQNGARELELLSAGFTQFQVSAVVALLTKVGCRPNTASAA